jgi:hypothetical protein
MRLWHFSAARSLVAPGGATTLATPIAHSLSHSRYHPIASKWTCDERKQVMDIFRQGRGDITEFKLRPAIPGLRNIMIGVVLVALFLLSFAVRITRIEAGHVGVEINLAGRQRGRLGIPVRTGWVIYSPLTTQISTPKRAWRFLWTFRCPMPSSPPRLRIFMSSTAWVSWTSSRTGF